MATAPVFERADDASASAGAIVIRGALTALQIEQARNPQRPIRELLAALDARDAAAFDDAVVAL